MFSMVNHSDIVETIIIPYYDNIITSASNNKIREYCILDEGQIFEVTKSNIGNYLFQSTCSASDENVQCSIVSSLRP